MFVSLQPFRGRPETGPDTPRFGVREPKFYLQDKIYHPNCHLFSENQLKIGQEE